MSIKNLLTRLADRRQRDSRLQISARIKVGISWGCDDYAQDGNSVVVLNLRATNGKLRTCELSLRPSQFKPSFFSDAYFDFDTMAQVLYKLKVLLCITNLLASPQGLV